MPYLSTSLDSSAISAMMGSVLTPADLAFPQIACSVTIAVPFLIFHRKQDEMCAEGFVCDRLV